MYSRIWTWQRIGLDNGDHLADVEERVERLPAELNQFFNGMLDFIDAGDEKDWQETYALLSMALSLPGRCPPIRFSFLAEYLRHPNSSPEALPVLSDAELEERLRSSQDRVRAKSVGLLELRGFKRKSRAFQHCVKFTHRSIVEFLTNSRITRRMAARLREYEYDPFRAACYTFLAHIKSIPNLYPGPAPGICPGWGPTIPIPLAKEPGVTDHVARTVRDSPKRATIQAAALCMTLFVWPGRDGSILVSFDSGVSPNEMCGNPSSSVWYQFLDGFFKSINERRPLAYLPMFLFLITRGADPRIEVTGVSGLQEEVSLIHPGIGIPVFGQPIMFSPPSE